MSFGKMAVDWEQRVDFDKLRKDRVEKANKAMKDAGVGAAVIFQFESKRYLTSYWAHPYARHLPELYYLFVKDNGFPYLPGRDMDWGAMGQAPWLKDRFLAEDKLPEINVAMWLPDEQKEALCKKIAANIKAMMKQHKVADLPVSVDWTTPLLIDALKSEGLKVVDGTNWMLMARMIKTPEEIELLRMAATCNESAYTELCRILRPGVRENDAQAAMVHAAYSAGAEYVEGWVTASGPRSSPRRFNGSDRTIRAGELFAIEMCHTTYCGYKNCMGRSWVVGAKPTEMQKDLYEQLAFNEDRMLKQLKPGASSHAVAKTAARNYFESVEDMRKYRATMKNHMGGMGMQWNELPQITTAIPDMKLEPGMVIAYAINGYIRNRKDGANELWNHAGCHIENTVVVTETGNEVLTRWPWRELIVVGYPGAYTGGETDQLNVTVK